MRKKKLLGSALGIVVLALIVGWGVQANKAAAQATAQIPLPGKNIPKFVDELPYLNIIDKRGDSTQLELQMTEAKSMVLPVNAVVGYTGTWTWSYLEPDQVTGTKPVPSYIGPIIVAQRGTPTEIKFVNNLGFKTSNGNYDTNVLAYKYSVDQTLHWADPLNHELNAEAKKVATGGYAGGNTYPSTGDLGAKNYSGPIPAVVHLHGGEVPPVLDGGPDSWVTSDGPYSGHGYWTLGGPQGPNATSNSFIYRYPNTQEAANIWFHDHTLGATRLNVYAGLAGGYVIVDPKTNNPNYPGPANLPGGRVAAEPLVPLVIQDRMFDTNGQLFFPADSAAGILWTTNPEHPYWVPEFVGDAIVVNGKTWPRIGAPLPGAQLTSKRYRFLFLNGSNARTYELFLVDPVTGLNGPPLWVIGTDGGYLDAPVKIDPNAAANNKLVIMPGERYDVIIDFNDPVYRASNPSGQLILRNTGRTPYPKGGTPNGATVGQIVKFFVGPALPAAADTSYDPAAGVPLRADMIVRLPATTPDLTRQLTLNEVMGLPKNATDPVTGVMTAYPGGPLEVLLNNTKWDGMRFNPASGLMEQVPGTDIPTGHPNLPTPIEYYYSEFPKEGDAEIWEIINLTADAHPIHLHLVQFQVLNRQNFNFSKYLKAYTAAFNFGGIVREAFGPPYLYNNSDNPTVTAISKIVGGNPNITPFLQGPAMAPLPQENGWKDTVVALPGQVTRLVVRWAPTDLPAATPKANLFFPFDPNGGHGYVWHCHIIDHEDNEMMRPTSVTPNPLIANPSSARTILKGTDY